MTPKRIRLQRTKGWRMPENTVRVDRRTKFGNPFDLRRSEHCWTAIAHGFKADRRGRQAASVAMFESWVRGGRPVKPIRNCGLYFERDGIATAVAISPALAAGQPPSLEEIRAELRGKNLGCWCKLCERHAEGWPMNEPCQDCEPCHGDVLIALANEEVT